MTRIPICRIGLLRPTSETITIIRGMFHPNIPLVRKPSIYITHSLWILRQGSQWFMRLFDIGSTITPASPPLTVDSVLYFIVIHRSRGVLWYSVFVSKLWIQYYTYHARDACSLIRWFCDLNWLASVFRYSGSRPGRLYMIHRYNPKHIVEV